MHNNKGVCHTVALSFTLKKSILRQKKIFFFLGLKNDMIAMASRLFKPPKRNNSFDPKNCPNTKENNEIDLGWKLCT